MKILVIEQKSDNSYFNFTRLTLKYNSRYESSNLYRIAEIHITTEKQPHKRTTTNVKAYAMLTQTQTRNNLEQSNGSN